MTGGALSYLSSTFLSFWKTTHTILTRFNGPILGEFCSIFSDKKARSPGAILGNNNLTSTHLTIGIRECVGIWLFHFDDFLKYQFQSCIPWVFALRNLALHGFLGGLLDLAISFFFFFAKLIIPLW